MASKTTLLLIVKDGKILLAKKKYGFGMGKFNGVGGKLEVGETVEQAMVRETFEEIGVVPKQYEKFGVLGFNEVVKGNRIDVEMHIYIAKDYEGEISESKEMAPEWFSLDKIPFDKMFADDSFWLPLILEGKKVKGFFVYDDDFNIVSKTLETVDNLD